MPRLTTGIRSEKCVVRWFRRRGKVIECFIFFNFMWPCIVTKFFLINPTDALNFSKFIFVKKIYMFRAVPPPFFRYFPLYIRYWYITCKFDDSFQARPSWSFTPTPPPSPGMRSWREWDLELCLSLHSLQVIHRDTAFTAIVGYSRILCTNNLTHIFFQSVVPQCETKIHVILRLSSKRKGRVNGIPTKRTVWTEITWLFFYFIPLFHQLPFHVQNINCTRQAPTKCIGIVCLWTEVWRAF